jgi:hypothetical protein
MKKILSRIAGNLLLLLVALLVGCGGSDGGKGKLAPVKGRVLFKNEGVTAASIFFMPDAAKGNQGPMGSSMLQEDGSFTITTLDIGPGLRPGAYKVKLDLGRRPEKELAKFRDVKTTPLSYEVTENGLPDLVIVLDDKDKNDKDKEKEPEKPKESKK